MWFSFISSPSTRLAEGSLLLHHPLRTPWAANKRLQLHSLLDEARLLIYQVSDLVLKMISMNKTILDSWCTLSAKGLVQTASQNPFFIPSRLKAGGSSAVWTVANRMKSYFCKTDWNCLWEVVLNRIWTDASQSEQLLRVVATCNG